MRITFASLNIHIALNTSLKFHIALNTYTKTHKTETNRSRHMRPFFVLHKQAKELDDFRGGGFCFINRTRSLWPISGDYQVSLAFLTSQGVPQGGSLWSSYHICSPQFSSPYSPKGQLQIPSVHIWENPINYIHHPPLPPRRPKPEKPNSGGSNLRLISINSDGSESKTQADQYLNSGGSKLLLCFRNKGRDTDKQPNTTSTCSHVRFRKQKTDTQNRDTGRHAHIPEGIPIHPSQFSGVRGSQVSRPRHQIKDPQREDSPTFWLRRGDTPNHSREKVVLQTARGHFISRVLSSPQSYTTQG
jgi:hypothetical protein